SKKSVLWNTTCSKVVFEKNSSRFVPRHCKISTRVAIDGEVRSLSSCEIKNQIQWIIPNAQKNMMEPILLTLEPNGSTYPDNPHEGEEFGYVLNGNITIIIGNKTYKAKKGEAFYFIPNRKHFIQASGKTGASLLWVTTPPSF
ncbi:MAG TPA: cupin domain-containing protein, partial [Lachnospiraceae bacterium]|nr:cupin domain-containing protein [Lachnospiraceae bacterium]